MVRVEGHGRRALGSVDVTDDGRATALDDDLDVEALAAQQLGHGLGAARDVGLVEADAAETLGMRTSSSRSARTCGMSSATRSRICLDLVRGEDVVSHLSDPIELASSTRGPARR